MCWNESVSLNTFLFSMSVLCLIMYNNAYTKYKIKELDNIWVYLFFASFISMQLVEFFIWRNINDKYYNHIFSVAGTILLLSQPFFSLMILSNIKLRNILLAICSLIVPYIIYKLLNIDIYSEVAKNGHLRWKWINTSPIIYILVVFFLSFSLFYEKKYVFVFLGLGLLGLSYYNYKMDDTYSSMWCWLLNSIMLYYAAYLLIYLPFLEKGQIC
jgi:hypothetical protein